MRKMRTPRTWRARGALAGAGWMSSGRLAAADEYGVRGGPNEVPNAVDDRDEQDDHEEDVARDVQAGFRLGLCVRQVHGGSHDAHGECGVGGKADDSEQQNGQKYHDSPPQTRAEAYKCLTDYLYHKNVIM